MSAFAVRAPLPKMPMGARIPGRLTGYRDGNPAGASLGPVAIRPPQPGLVT
jgi:hypothetical protein